MFSSAATAGSVRAETMYPTTSSMHSLMIRRMACCATAMAAPPMSMDSPPVTGISAMETPALPARTPRWTIAAYFMASIAVAALSRAPAMVRAPLARSFTCLFLTLPQ
ncbi:hypothetical protein SCALM49S_05555 [Streptomyces californicus]